MPDWHSQADAEDSSEESKSGDDSWPPPSSLESFRAALRAIRNTADETAARCPCVDPAWLTPEKAEKEKSQSKSGSAAKSEKPLRERGCVEWEFENWVKLFQGSRLVAVQIKRFLEELRPKTSLLEDLCIRRVSERAAEAAGLSRRTDSEPEPDSDCPICLEQLTNPESVMTPCGHMLHFHCILRSMETNPVCPICRRNVEEGALVRICNGIPKKAGCSSKEDVGCTEIEKNEANGKVITKVDEERESQSKLKSAQMLDCKLAATLQDVRDLIRDAESFGDHRDSFDELLETMCELGLRRERAMIFASTDLANMYEGLVSAVQKREMKVARSRREVAAERVVLERLIKSNKQKELHIVELENKLEKETKLCIQAREIAAQQKVNYLNKSRQIQRNMKKLERFRRRETVESPAEQSKNTAENGFEMGTPDWPSGDAQVGTKTLFCGSGARSGFQPNVGSSFAMGLGKSRNEVYGSSSNCGESGEHDASRLGKRKLAPGFLCHAKKRYRPVLDEGDAAQDQEVAKPNDGVAPQPLSFRDLNLSRHNSCGPRLGSCKLTSQCMQTKGTSSISLGQFAPKKLKKFGNKPAHSFLWSSSKQ